MTVNRFGVDRLTPEKRAELEALKAKRTLSQKEAGKLSALAMSGGHQDRAWLEQHAPLSRQAASMGTPRASGSLTAEQLQAAIEKGMRGLREQLQAAIDQYRDGED